MDPMDLSGACGAGSAVSGRERPSRVASSSEVTESTSLMVPTSKPGRTPRGGAEFLLPCGRGVNPLPGDSRAAHLPRTVAGLSLLARGTRGGRPSTAQQLWIQDHQGER